MECHTLQWHLQKLINEGYLWEFIPNPGLPLEVRVQRLPETMASPKAMHSSIQERKHHLHDLYGRRHHHEGKDHLCQRNLEGQLSDSIDTSVFTTGQAHLLLRGRHIRSALPTQ